MVTTQPATPTTAEMEQVTKAKLITDLRTVFGDVEDLLKATASQTGETCASIPGPNFVECGGPGGGGAPGGGEGYVHIHAGIHGIGDLDPALRDWRNPVARITIRRVAP